MSIRPFLSSTMAVLLTAVVALSVPLSTHAADWPTQPIKLLVGFSAGSTPDLVARTLSKKMAEALGQPVVVVNKPGASGNIAAAAVANASDEYTLGIVINGNLTSSPILYSDVSYDPIKDFSYLSLLTTAPLVLVAQTSLPGGAAFFEEGKKQGDAWNYGSVGIGSTSHLGVEVIKSKVPGFDPRMIPFSGGSPAILTAIIGGRIQMGLLAPGTAMQQVKADNVQAIGVTSLAESKLAPGVPPLSKVLGTQLNLEVWCALVGPATLPKAVQSRITKLVNDILADPEIQAKLLAQGWQAVGTTSAEMKQRVKDETKVIGDIIRAQDISVGGN